MAYRPVLHWHKGCSNREPVVANWPVCPTTISVSNVIAIGRGRGFITTMIRKTIVSVNIINRKIRLKTMPGFLKRARYASLFELKVTDYRGWAKGLKRCGYATDKSYANKLIQTIELYELYKYDRRSFKPIRAKDLLPVIVANPHPVYRSWGLLYVEARDGDSLESIAKEFGFSVKKLAKYNEVPKDYPLEAGDIVYLEKKKKKAEKGYDFCIVRSGDSMHTIAQRYGIQLKNLYKMNKLPDDYTPSVGDTLRLR